ncbi:hypothetical protein CEG14_13260 [Bordetella genomosp. 1]|uniref:Poly-beta-1,6-N-acetyl-D-glucosamine biosynthesis protein PgaD n=1 Tax=Bordetella genomosp. 1 TaxID=1395607 RepID=A0A261SG20_9BORD|nr:hypothetical protein [Bordetella genomosp. 1]OZI36001.1 hypothetical protein CEG14_13260 [Bordetella genomosp. 1]
MPKEPIIDNTDLPLSTWLRVAGPVAGACRWLWLNIARPLLLVAVWAGFIFFVYWDFFMTTAQSTADRRFLLYCGIGVAALLALMLIVARLVRHREDDENKEADTPEMARPVRVHELAAVARVPVRQMSVWQRARSLVAMHDDDGQFRDAVLKPLSEPVRRRPRR